MTLNKYLQSKKKSPWEFAEESGFSIFAVRKWLNGERIPRDINKVKIAKLTKNEVGPADWLRGFKS